MLWQKPLVRLNLGFFLMIFQFGHSVAYAGSFDLDLGTHSQQSLRERWDREQVEPLSEMREPLFNYLNGKPILFIRGILNELNSLVGLYMTESMKAAKELHMDVHVFGPDSWNGIYNNAAPIAERIRKVYFAPSNVFHKPVTIVGHSKGASESIMTYLTHPEIWDYVDRIISIQGSMGGSPLALEKLRWRMLGISFFAHPGVRSFFEWPGMQSLTPENAQREFYGAMNYFNLTTENMFSQDELAAKRAEILNKIYFVRSQEDFDQLGLGISLVLRYEGKKQDVFNDQAVYQENDGIVSIKAQMIEGLGHDLGVLKHVDHFCLTILGFSGWCDGRQQSFTRALIEQAYEGQNEFF